MRRIVGILEAVVGCIVFLGSLFAIFHEHSLAQVPPALPLVCLGGFAVMVVGHRAANKGDQPPPAQTKTCKACLQTIPMLATRCHHCTEAQG